MPKNPTKYIVVDNTDPKYFQDLEEFDSELCALDEVRRLIEDAGTEPDDICVYRIQERNFKVQQRVSPGDADD